MNDSRYPLESASMTSQRNADHAARHAAITLALTLPGDATLYLLLPLYAPVFGVSLPEVGVLLAANRLVRIAGYGWVARFYAHEGPRAACLVAAIGAAISTLGYAHTDSHAKSTHMDAKVARRLRSALSFRTSRQDRDIRSAESTKNWYQANASIHRQV